MVEYFSPKCGSPLPTPNPNSYYFPSGLPALPSGDTPYSSIPLSQAWLVVGCWAAHISADSWPSALGPLVVDARIFTFISSLWVRASGPQILKTPVQSRCHWRVMSDNPTLSHVSPAVFCGWRTGCRQARTDCRHVSGSQGTRFYGLTPTSQPKTFQVRRVPALVKEYGLIWTGTTLVLGTFCGIIFANSHSAHAFIITQLFPCIESLQKSRSFVEPH